MGTEKVLFKNNYSDYNIIYGIGTTGKLIIHIADEIGLKIECILVGDGY